MYSNSIIFIPYFQLVYDFRAKGNFCLLSTIPDADRHSDELQTFRNLGFELPTQM